MSLRWLLYARSWQILLLTFSFTWLIYLIIISGRVNHIFGNMNQKSYLILVLLFSSISYLYTFLGWCWAIVFHLNPPGTRSDNWTIFFKLAGLLLACIPTLILILFAIITYVMLVPQTDGFLFKLGFPGRNASFLILILIILSYCYIVAFTAFKIMRAEVENALTFKGIIEPIILVIFFPLGILVLQPKLNKIMNIKLQDPLI